jgi:enterochelin esterase family protein
MSAGVPLRDPLAFHGRVELQRVTSEVLRGNALGDPHERELPVYVPPGAHGPLPVVFLLAGFTSRGQSMLETHPWKEGVARTYDRAVARGAAPPALLVMPDCFTRYGGSQYVNSPAVGRYEDHVADELVPLVDARYDTLAGRRAVCGKSSGGFGALHLAMRRPGLFPVVASIAGDCHFEFCFGADLLPATRGLLQHGGDPATFLAAFEVGHDLSGDGHAVLNTLAMSACFSPNPDAPLGFDLPFDPRTGERDEKVWTRWKAFDPAHACARYAQALRGLELLHLEAGLRDEFHMQLGLRILVRRLRALDVPCEHVEFDGGHFGLDARYAELLPKLVRALTRPARA